jgi:uncharacterized lipoprotein YddW (UPF0748 family)
MSLFGPDLRPRRTIAALVAAILLFGLSGLADPLTKPSQESAAAEIRALWVLRTTLASPDTIAAMVRSAREHGFNTLLVQVRGRGDAYYNGGLEPRAAELQRQPAGFDPLAAVLEAGHAAGLRVHAWINVNLVSSAVDLPIAQGHLIHRHPSWLMVPRDIAQDLASVPPESPAYVGKLARWARAQTGGVEGLYASPAIPAAADYAESIVRDISHRYAVDGVHFDYTRYPSARFDYSRDAIAEFRTTVRPRLTDAVRRSLDDREKVDLFAYTDALQDDWRAFRIARMTSLMTRLSGVVRTERPEALVTVAVAPDVREAYEQRLQDWGTWVQNDLVDAICPMAYSPEPERFAEQIATARSVAGTRAVWAGIGAYRLPASQTIQNIQTARRLGAAGVILFSYDSLIDPKVASPDYLAVVGKAAFAQPSGNAASR